MWNFPDFLDINLLFVVSPITAAIAWSMFVAKIPDL